MKKKDILILASLLIVLIIMYLHSQRVSKIQYVRYNKMFEEEIHGVIEDVEILKATSIIRLRGSEDKLYFTPRQCNVMDFCLECRPHPGDSMAKKSMSDTVLLYRDSLALKICLFPFQ